MAAPDESDSRPWVDRPPATLATGCIDFARSRFIRTSGAVEVLTAREAELLAYLADHANRAVSRDDLLVNVWGHHELSMSRAVDAAIRRVRVKLEVDPAEPEVLFTVHGHGYRLLYGAAPAAPSPDGAEAEPRRTLRLADRIADLSAGWVEGPRGRTPLTAKERLVLEYLSAARGAAVDAQKLARKAGVIGGKRALSNTVYRLRSKLESDPRAPRFLVSVPGGGYRLDAQIDEPRFDDDQIVRALRSLTDHVGLVVGLDDCVVYLRDGDDLTQVAAYGPKRAPDGGVREPLTQRVGEGIAGLAASRDTPLYVRDVRAESAYVEDLVPARSELAVPVRAAGRVVGVLDSESTEVDAFDDATMAVFVSLAAIAAPAFARLVGDPYD